MEIKATLQKPYTENERMDFIIIQNHNFGYEIQETESELQAWGFTEKEIAQDRELEFHKAFFNTSLGYIKRKVNMQDGSIKDFLSDLLPVIAIGINSGNKINVIAYKKPNFKTEVENWEEYQEEKQVTAQFINECFTQLSNDFFQ